ncbi:hypothetical protein BC833DRAFT_21625 [Globomyces pollinis-pini]|nr:hypothetical protein BC833DRAFT_21625 [Globomyces pollinis-pini]
MSVIGSGLHANQNKIKLKPIVPSQLVTQHSFNDEADDLDLHLISVSNQVDSALESLLKVPVFQRSKQITQAIELLFLHLESNPSINPSVKLQRLKTLNFIQEIPSRKVSVSVKIGNADDSDTDDDDDDNFSVSSNLKTMSLIDELNSTETLSGTQKDGNIVSEVSDSVDIASPGLQRRNTKQKLQKARNLIFRPNQAQKSKSKSNLKSNTESNCDSNATDSSISLKEFKGLVYSMGYFLNDEEVAIAINSLDPNNDGRISSDDFCTWWESDPRFKSLQLTPQETVVLQSVIRYFQYHDENGDGLLSKQEFNLMLEELNRVDSCLPSDTDADQLYNQINVFGNISFNDFIRWILRSKS